MPFLIAAGIGAAGSLIGGAMSSSASRSAARTQADAADRASQAQLQSTREGIGANATATTPWRNVGAGGLYQLADLLGIDASAMMNGAGGSNVAGSELIPGMPQPGARSANFGSLMQPFGADKFQTDPGYQFRLDEGARGVENSAAARGMQLSGANLMGLDRYNQNFASNEYQNAYNRYNTDQSNQFNRLASLAGIGQQAAGQQGATAANLMGQYGQAVGNNITGAGNAMAAGQVGSANAIGGAISGAANSGTQALMLQSLFGNGGGGGGQGMGGMSPGYNIGPGQPGF